MLNFGLPVVTHLAHGPAGPAEVKTVLVAPHCLALTDPTFDSFLGNGRGADPFGVHLALASAAAAVPARQALVVHSVDDHWVVFRAFDIGAHTAYCLHVKLLVPPNCIRE